MTNHINNAVSAMWKKMNYCDEDGENPFLNTDGNKIIAHIQEGPIGDVGENGIQAVELLDFCAELFKSFNNAYPCRENSLTITKIEEAIHWQDARTKDRERRGVEGQNKD